MKRWQELTVLVVILAIAAALRLTAVDWDDYHHYHPDERYITWVATTIGFSTNAAAALNPFQSPFNPFYWPPDAASEGILVLQDQRRDFAYGHVPLYLGVLATRIMEAVGPALLPFFPTHWLFTRDLLNDAGAIEFRHLTAVSRALTALFDVGTVSLVYLLGRHLYRPQVGLLAAAFLAFNVMHIQLAHFFISDPFLTFFAVAAVLCMVVTLQAAGNRWQMASDAPDQASADASLKRHRPSLITFCLFLAAICTGLAIGSKFAAVLLLLPLALAIYGIGGPRWKRWLATAVLTVLLTFSLTNPFAILDLSCEVVTPALRLGPVTIPAFNWGSCYLQNVATQGAMVRGSSDITFTRQYIGTLPYLYFIEMQIRWGMGVLLGIAAFLGFAWEIWAVFRGTGKARWRSWPQTCPHLFVRLVILAWVIPYFLFTGAFLVKFMRYLQPVTPFFMLYAAAMLAGIRWKWARWAATTAVLLGAAFYAFSFVNLYRQPHPWVAGSRWVYENVPPGALILSEQWDDALPTTMPVNGRARTRSEYLNDELTWLTGADERDNMAKLERNLERLAAGDYLTIMSSRVYGVAPRLPDRYPLSGQYHQLLFDGALGYEPVYVATRAPNLLGVQLVVDHFAGPGLAPPAAVQALLAAQPGLNLGRADESFTVYDQPLLIIFQNTGRLSPAQMLAQFEPARRSLSLQATVRVSNWGFAGKRVVRLHRNRSDLILNTPWRRYPARSIQYFKGQ